MATYGRSGYVQGRASTLLIIAAGVLAAIVLQGTAFAADSGSPQEKQDKSPTDPGTPSSQDVVVKGFRFKGNTSIPTSELEALLAPYVGQSCDLRKLQEAASRVSEEYRRRGLVLARAYLPAQEIENGIIEIAILEGRIGEIHVEGNRNYSADFIRAFLHEALSDPAVTNEQLEHGLLLLNTEFQDLKVSAVLEPGKEPGTVDLRAKVEDSFPLHATLSFDNFGSDLVSRYRFGLQVDWTNAVIDGSLLSLFGMMGEEAEDLAYGTGKYLFPINRIGTKVGVYGGYGSYQVSEQFAELGITGDTASGGASITHPFVRNRTLGLSGEFGFQINDTEYFLLGQTSSHDKVRLLYAALSFDTIHWDGKSFVTLNLSQGLGEFLDGLSEDDPEASRLDADNSFTRATLSVARLQRISDVFSVFARASGQWSSDSLVAGEEWRIGGANSVRGYVSGEATGDNGYNLSLEFRAAPFENREICQLVGFVDYGWAHRRTVAFAQEEDSDLTGVGLGARSHLSFINADLRLEVAWPVDPDRNSLDEDPVAYVSASVRF